MPQEHQRKPTTKPAAVVTKKAPAPVPKDPGSSPAPTPRDAGDKWEINAPSSIELVGSGSGRLVTTEVLVSARLPASASFIDGVVASVLGPRVLVTLSDGSVITLSQAPRALPVEGVSSENQDPTHSVVLDFLPLADSTVHASLEVQVLDGPYQALSIPIVAYSDLRQRAGAPLSERKPDVNTGRIKLPNHVHLGDTVVGSRNAFTVASPLITGGHGGAADLRAIDPHYPRSSPATPAVLDLPGVSLRPSAILPKNQHVTLIDGLESRIEVDFAPDRPGSFTEALEVKVGWDDNHSETHRITITALAHGLKDLAWKDRAPAPSTRPTPAPQELTRDQTSSPEYESYRDAATRAVGNAGDLAAEQREGVVDAERDVSTYQKLKPSAPWWQGILEVAVLSGISGLATIVGRTVAQSIVAKTLPSGLDEFAIKKVKDLQSVVVGADALKESMKQAGKAAISKSSRPAAPGADDVHGTKPAPAREPSSSIPKIDFFSTQRSLCGKVHKENRDMVLAQKQQLNSLFAISPQAAIATMTLLGNAFTAATTEAKKMQAVATHTGWMQVLAREQLGTETLAQEKRDQPRRGPESQVVTSIAPDRFPAPHGSAYGRSMVNGVLSITVQITDFHGDIAKVDVRNSMVIGVTNAARDKLVDVPISDLPVPLEITGNWRGAVSTITRDEAGRVRVAGRIPHSSGTYTELDMHRNAERIVEMIGARSLVGWGVQLETNDATKLGAKDGGHGN